LKLYKPSEANMLFDGASLVLYMCGITVYIANIVKGLRVVTAGSYGTEELVEGETVVTAATPPEVPGAEGQIIGREDSLRVLAASNTILALVLVGVLVLQAGQWYAIRKEEAEIEEMNKKADEKRKAKSDKKRS
jgi:ER membrane protein SH3